MRRWATPSGLSGLPLKKYHFLVILPWMLVPSMSCGVVCRQREGVCGVGGCRSESKISVSMEDYGLRGKGGGGEGEAIN